MEHLYFVAPVNQKPRVNCCRIFVKPNVEMEKEIDRIYTAVVNIELYKIKLNVKHNICPI